MSPVELEDESSGVVEEGEVDVEAEVEVEVEPLVEVDVEPPVEVDDDASVVVADDPFVEVEAEDEPPARAAFRAACSWAAASSAVDESPFPDESSAGELSPDVSGVVVVVGVVDVVGEEVAPAPVTAGGLDPMPVSPTAGAVVVWPGAAGAVLDVWTDDEEALLEAGGVVPTPVSEAAGVVVVWVGMEDGGAVLDRPEEPDGLAVEIAWGVPLESEMTGALVIAVTSALTTGAEAKTPGAALLWAPATAAFGTNE